LVASAAIIVLLQIIFFNPSPYIPLLSMERKGQGIQTLSVIPGCREKGMSTALSLAGVPA
jgi:hypothetical protein